jgi:hypothetical protein
MPIGYGKTGKRIKAHFMLEKVLGPDWEAEPKTLTGFWFSEFGAKPQTPQAKAEGRHGGRL